MTVYRAESKLPSLIISSSLVEIGSIVDSFELSDRPQLVLSFLREWDSRPFFCCALSQSHPSLNPPL